MNNTDFAQGTLLGLAVGDALGTTVEFRRRDSFPLHTEMTGGGAFQVKPGEWTDDTAMALCLAESLLACEGFDSKDQLSRYVHWMDAGYMACQENCIDIGNTTRISVEKRLRKDRWSQNTAGNFESAWINNIDRESVSLQPKFSFEG